MHVYFLHFNLFAVEMNIPWLSTARVSPTLILLT